MKKKTTTETELQIEKGIPIPQRGCGLAQTFKNMNVGDSVVLARQYQTRIYSYARIAKVKMTSRIVDDATIRVWRIE